MTENAIKELQEKVAKLEKKRNFNLWLQFLVFPIILAGMGYLFQNSIKQSEKRVEQLKITQSIVHQVFNDQTVERTVILREILDEILENDDLAKKIQKSIDAYLKNKAVTGTAEEAKNVIAAVNTYAANDTTLKSSFDNSEVIQNKVSKYDRAISKEYEAFEYLVNGDLKAAEKAFREVEEIYPKFHQAYEIAKYLRTNASENPTTQEIREIQNHIGTTMSWKTPPEFIPRLIQ